jgi:NAD(P)-dependent dehydrogenase (short-subunit alcohol dehydrogenase family)
MKDLEGKPLWTDGKIWTFVYQRRAGKWVIVQARSRAARRVARRRSSRRGLPAELMAGSDRSYRGTKTTPPVGGTMTMGLEGHHLVITGGDGALGAAVVEAFLAAGATCHLPILGLGSAAPEPGARLTGGVNLTDEGAVEAYYAALPPIVASVHLAGGFLAKPIAETTRADLDRQVALNLVTTFLCCREAVKAMRKSGGGRIVNVAARVVEIPAGGMVAYSASKAAVAALTRALAEEVRQENIQVNAVLPSIIDTPANRAAMPNANVGRWPQPAELGETIRWLASPENRLTSGALIPVYGKA